MEPSVDTVGGLIREWRGIHGLSQLDLALASGVSSRHISFIETGRSRPSRAMVLRLAEVLDVPLRERNTILLAAGFAPLYRESELQHADLAPVRRALELVLRSHEPYPAFVLDRAWDIVLANRAHRRFLALLLPDAVRVPPTVNALRLVLDPKLLRPRVLDWERVAHVLGHRVRRQLRIPNLSPDLRRHFDELLALPGVAEAMAGPPAAPESAIVIPLRFEQGGQTVSWFSTIATIGTAQDVTLDELRIESLFPADDATAQAARNLAESSDD